MINKKQLIYNKQLNYWDKKIRQLENNVGWETRSHMQSADQLNTLFKLHEYVLEIFMNYSTYSWIPYVFLNTIQYSGILYSIHEY